jgi:predicted O-methyltransferase YrrM
MEVAADRPDPSIITELATGYWASMVLIAANRLGVFTAIGEESLPASEVAKRCSVDARTLEMLLNACVAKRLLVKQDSAFRNSATSKLFLLRGSPAFLGDALKYTEDLYPVWGQLEQAIRTSRPPLPQEDYLGSDPEKTRNFVYGMHNRALGIAKAVVAGLSVDGKRQMLDVGGGPGTYSILIAQKTPGLHSTVFDLPGVIQIAREIVADHNCSDRVSVTPGDYLKDAFPGGNDVVLMSGMMHREVEQDCRKLLQKAYDSLSSDGLLIVSDVMFDNDAHTNPPLAALFALNMMLTSESGSTHASTEMLRWMADAGFVDLKSECLPSPMSHVALLTGKKK